MQRTITESQREPLEQEFASLNLSRYVQEAVRDSHFLQPLTSMPWLLVKYLSFCIDLFIRKRQLALLQHQFYHQEMFKELWELFFYKFPKMQYKNDFFLQFVR